MIQKFHHMLTRRIRDERGFTLVELLMVMVIIGVLAGLGFTGFNALQKRSAITKADVYWRDLNTAVAMNRMESNEPATNVSALSDYIDVDSEPWRNLDPVPQDAVTTSSDVAYLLQVVEGTGEAAEESEVVCVYVDGYASVNNTKAEDGNAGCPTGK